jgi:hypothetical protein
MVPVFERISKRALLGTGFALVAAAGLTSSSELAGAVNAEAGEYHVYSCRTPSGQSAPADGWSGSVAAGGAYDDYAANTCSGGGALIAALGNQTGHVANTDLATWAFEVPQAARLAGATLWRAGDTAGGATANATYQFWLAGPNETNIFDECIYTLKCNSQGELSQPLSTANRVAVANAYLGSHLYLNASCGGVSGYECKAALGDPNGYAAAVYLFAADLVLEQNVGPSAGNVGGELASSPAVRGTSDLTFSATDPGSGVYEAVFSVDGQVIQSTVPNENGGRCRNVGQTADGLAAFLYVQPCPLSVSADVPFDTTRLSDGEHHLIVSVVDAAGNSAPVLDRQITVANPPPPCAPGAAGGTNVSPQATLTAGWKGTAKERLTTPFGRGQTVIGRLTGPGGAPIAGALIDLTATPLYAGAGAVAIPGPRTGPDGRFSVRLPGGLPSRTLCLAFRSPDPGAGPALTRTLILTVRAGISLGVSPRTTSVGRRISFRGRLLGSPIPAGGKQLVLEARSPGSPWLEFDVIRTDARGGYRASYRFKFPGPADYQFRVLSEPESDYPFAGGSSNVVRVYER